MVPRFPDVYGGIKYDQGVEKLRRWRVEQARTRQTSVIIHASRPVPVAFIESNEVDQRYERPRSTQETQQLQPRWQE